MNSHTRRQSFSPAPPSPVLQHSRPQPQYFPATTGYYSNKVQFLSQAPVIQYQRVLTEDRSIERNIRNKENQDSRMKSDIMSRSQVKGMLEEWKNALMDEVNSKIRMQYEHFTEETRKLQETDIILQKNITSMYDQILEQVDSKLKSSRVNELDKRLDEQMKVFAQFQEEVRIPYQSITLKQTDQIEQLRQQISELKESVLKKSIISVGEREVEYTYKNSELYDAYIRKFETFNKQVSEYMQNRKIPEHLQKVLTLSKVRMTQEVKDDSPMKSLNDLVQADDDEDGYSDFKQVRSEYKSKMSTIMEKEQEEDEVIYHYH